MSSTTKYVYEKISELRPKNMKEKTNCFGIVCKLHSRGTVESNVILRDESGETDLLISHFAPEHQQNVEVGDIIRIHRAVTEECHSDVCLKANRKYAGCAIVVWPNDDASSKNFEPKFATSASFTMDQFSMRRITELRNFSMKNPSTSAPFRVPISPAEPEADAQNLDMTELSHFSALSYKNILVQVIGVFYSERGEMILRCWDGTNLNHEMVRLTKSNKDYTLHLLKDEDIAEWKTLPSNDLVVASRGRCVDVSIYGEHTKRLERTKSGDIVAIINVNYTCTKLGFAYLKLGGDTNHGKTILKCSKDYHLTKKLIDRCAAFIENLLPDQRDESVVTSGATSQVIDSYSNNVTLEGDPNLQDTSSSTFPESVNTFPLDIAKQQLDSMGVGLSNQSLTDTQKSMLAALENESQNLQLEQTSSEVTIIQRTEQHEEISENTQPGTADVIVEQQELNPENTDKTVADVEANKELSNQSLTDTQKSMLAALENESQNLQLEQTSSEVAIIQRTEQHEEIFENTQPGTADVIVEQQELNPENTDKEVADVEANKEDDCEVIQMEVVDNEDDYEQFNSQASYSQVIPPKIVQKRSNLFLAEGSLSFKDRLVGLIADERARRWRETVLKKKGILSWDDEVQCILSLEKDATCYCANWVRPAIGSNENLSNSVTWGFRCTNCFSQVNVKRGQRNIFCASCFKNKKELHTMEIVYRVTLPFRFKDKNGNGRFIGLRMDHITFSRCEPKCSLFSSESVEKWYKCTDEQWETDKLEIIGKIKDICDKYKFMAAKAQIRSQPMDGFGRTAVLDGIDWRIHRIDEIGI